MCIREAHTRKSRGSLYLWTKKKVAVVNEMKGRKKRHRYGGDKRSVVGWGERGAVDWEL